MVIHAVIEENKVVRSPLFHSPEPTERVGLAEIYTMHSFAPFSNLNFFVKNRQIFFAIEYSLSPG